MDDADLGPAPRDVDGERRIMDRHVSMGVDGFIAEGLARGDFDRSGVAAFADVPLFVGDLMQPTLADTCAGDLDGDGNLDREHIHEHIQWIVKALP